MLVTNAFKSRCLLCLALCVCAALFLPISASAQAAHRSPWSQWGPVNDAHLNAIDFSIRKGDNNILERGMIFVRIRNRYTTNASGEVSFDLVNSGTGDVISSTEGFDLKPGQVDEYVGNWFMLPGVKDGADAWSATAGSARNVQMKVLRLPDATGNMTEVYPVDKIAAQTQKAADDLAKKQAEERRQQAEAAASKQQADQQAATRQADRERQARDDREKAATDRQAAVQKREEDDQNRRQEVVRQAEENRQAEAHRKAQVVLDQSNERMQNMANVDQVDIASRAQSQQREKDIDAELVRRRQEISDQSRDSVDPKISQLQSDLEEPQGDLATAQAGLDREKSEVERYKQMADADREPLTSAVNRIAQSMAENEARDYQTKANRAQADINSIQRKIEREQTRWDREKETALNTALADAQANSNRTRTATITQPEPDPPTVATLAQQAAAAAAIGLSLWEKNRWPEVETAYREAIRLQPADWAYSRNLGVSLSQQNKWPEAEKFFREAVRLQPENAVCRNSLGDALWHQKKYGEAETAFREATHLSPNDAEAQHNLGIALQSQEKWVDAQAAYREAVRLMPENKEYQQNLADATQNLQTPPDSHNGHDSAYYEQCNKAQSLVFSKTPAERERGRVLLSAFIDQQPDKVWGRWSLISSYLNDDKYDQADKVVRDGLKLLPLNKEMQDTAWNSSNILGLVYLDRKQYAKSAAYFKRAISLRPNIISCYGMLGIVYTRAKLFKQAEEMRREVEKHKAMNLLHPEPQGI